MLNTELKIQHKMSPFKVTAIITILLLVQVITACSSDPSNSSNLRNWRVGTVAPSMYPVIVERGVYGINKQNNWTSKLHTHTHMWSNTELLTVRKIFPDYQGFGLPLAEETISMQSQLIKRTELPDVIHLNWASLVEGKFYATTFELTPNIKQRMMTQQRYVGNYGQTWQCYETDIVFGLLPSGIAKVWLTGCGDQFTSLGQISASAVSSTDFAGKSIESYQYKIALQRTKKRVNQINKLNGSLNQTLNHEVNLQLERGQKNDTNSTNYDVHSSLPWQKINKEYTIAPSWHILK